MFMPHIDRPMTQQATIPFAAITLLCFIFTSRPLLSEPRISDGSDIGMRIMGAIVQKKGGGNVVLIKNLRSGQVDALKLGGVFDGKFKVADIQLNYIALIASSAPQNQTAADLLVYKDKFGMDAIKSGYGRPSSPAAHAINVDDVYREDGFERRQGIVKMSSSYRDNILQKELPKIMMQASAQPFLMGGRIVGFQLTQIDNGSIYQKTGLKDNDVVTAVNGKRLDSVANAVSILQNAKTTDEVEVEILRDGQPIHIKMLVK